MSHPPQTPAVGRPVLGPLDAHRRTHRLTRDSDTGTVPGRWPATDGGTAVPTGITATPGPRMTDRQAGKADREHGAVGHPCPQSTPPTPRSKQAMKYYPDHAGPPVHPQPFYPPPAPRHRRPRRLHPLAIVGIVAGVALFGLCGVVGIAAAVDGDRQIVKPVELATEPPPSTERAPDPEPADAVTDDQVIEQVFVDLIRDEYGPEFVDIPDETIVDLGHTRCREIDDEGLEALMLRLALDPDVDPEMAGYFTGASIQAFCPEYMDDLEDMAS